MSLRLLMSNIFPHTMEERAARACTAYRFLQRAKLLVQVVAGEPDGLGCRRQAEGCKCVASVSSTCGRMWNLCFHDVHRISRWPFICSTTTTTQRLDPSTKKLEGEM